MNKRKGRRSDDKERKREIGEKDVGRGWGGGGGRREYKRERREYKRERREGEDYRERREVKQISRGRRGKRDYTKHQQQPLKFTCLR